MTSNMDKRSAWGAFILMPLSIIFLPLSSANDIKNAAEDASAGGSNSAGL